MPFATSFQLARPRAARGRDCNSSGQADTPNVRDLALNL